MSTQKYRLVQNDSFTAVSNRVVRGLEDYAEALGLYLILLSLPTDWIFYKTELMKRCAMGRDKLDKLLSFLCSVNLVQIEGTRAPDGRFRGLDMHILNGMEFKNVQKKSKKSVVQPFTEKPLTDFQGLDNTHYIINKNKTNKNNKTNISCSAEAERDRKVEKKKTTNQNHFDKFWTAWPRKQKRQAALKQWVKHGCDKIAETIIAKVIAQKSTDVQWKNAQYIPLPDTYLNNRQWEDEIIVEKPKLIPNSNQNQARSAVPEWGPGHPSYDAMRGR